METLVTTRIVGFRALRNRSRSLLAKLILYFWRARWRNTGSGICKRSSRLKSGPGAGQGNICRLIRTRPSNCPRYRTRAPLRLKTRLCWAGGESDHRAGKKEQAIGGTPRCFLGKTVRSATRASNRKAFSSTFSLNWAKQADVPSDSGNPRAFHSAYELRRLGTI